MPNTKVLAAAAEQRRQLAPEAQRLYERYRTRVPKIIRRLAGPTQAEHDRAFEQLAGMGDLIVAELRDALADPGLPDDAVDEVVALLGMTGDERAREPLWRFFDEHRDDPDRASTAALSLAGLGDERVLPFMREQLDDSNLERASNAVAALITLGALEDIPRLRATHMRHRADRELRAEIANAITAILGETDAHTLERTLEQIRTSFADRDLWDDIWRLLDSTFGPKPAIQ